MKSSVFLFLFLLFATTYSLAQAQGPPPPPGSNNPTPFGLVEILIGAGAAYGARASYKKRKQNLDDR